MHRPVLLLLALLALAVPGFSQKLVLEKIPLRFLAAPDTAHRLKTGLPLRRPGNPERESRQRTLLPEGIVLVAPNIRDNSLTVRGTARAIETLKERIQQTDLSPQKVLMNARVTSVRFTADGQRKETAMPLSDKGNGIALLAALLRDQPVYTVSVLPRLNDDNSLTLTMVLGFNNQAGLWERRTVRVQAGQTTPRFGVTNSPNAKVQEVVRQGRMPERWEGEFVAYYLEATPTITEDNAAVL